MLFNIKTLIKTFQIAGLDWYVYSVWAQTTFLHHDAVDF